jgi:hypothetical protein
VRLASRHNAKHDLEILVREGIAVQPEICPIIDGRLKVQRVSTTTRAWRGGQRQVVTLLAADADLFQSGNGRVDS